MSAAILKWLSGNDTGSSSKAIALCALGGDAADGAARYPRDGSDFGRCQRLLAAAPEARVGLERLAAACPYWGALFARWDEIAKAYEADLTSKRGGGSYALMRSILEPIEARDRRHINLGNGASVRFGGSR